MTLSEIANTLGLAVRCGESALGATVARGYVSDLMSDVLANGSQGDIWITLQTHPNIVAIANVREIAGVVLVNSREPEAETLEKARQVDIPILVSELPAFELVGRLYGLGIPGL